MARATVRTAPTVCVDQPASLDVHLKLASANGAFRAQGQRSVGLKLRTEAHHAVLLPFGLSHREFEGAQDFPPRKDHISCGKLGGKGRRVDPSDTDRALHRSTVSPDAQSTYILPHKVESLVQCCVVCVGGPATQQIEFVAMRPERGHRIGKVVLGTFKRGRHPLQKRVGALVSKLVVNPFETVDLEEG